MVDLETVDGVRPGTWQNTGHPDELMSLQGT